MLIMYNIYGKRIFVVFLVVAISTIVLASPLSLPIASALEKRDYSYLNDNQCTARYNCAGAQICGDHLCKPGEWEKLQAKLSAAQLGHEGGRNVTQTTTEPSTTTPSAPTSSVPTSVCESIKNILSGAGVSSSTVAKVMTDLGCR